MKTENASHQLKNIISIQSPPGMTNTISHTRCSISYHKKMQHLSLLLFFYFLNYLFFRLHWNNVDIFMFPLEIFQKIRLFLEQIFFMPDIYANKTLSCGVLQRINQIWEAKKLMIIGKTFHQA